MWRKVISRKNYLLLLGLFCVLLFFIRLSRSHKERKYKAPTKYLVNTEQCKIPAYDVDHPDVLNLIERKHYIPCQEGPPSSEVSYNSTLRRYILKLIRKPNETCFFSEDDLSAKYILSADTVLAPGCELAYVICWNPRGKKTYMNFHILVPHNPEIDEKTKKWKLRKKPPSVMVIGIDTMSRLNFFRTMKLTSATVLNDSNEWFPLEGYNKVGGNTFPNLMAVLKGWSSQDVYKICDPVWYYLDVECPLIWTNFQKSGYVTAYAEDFDIDSTFKFFTRGFKYPPTDYDFIPMFMKASIGNREFGKCLGYKYGPELLYEYVVDFAKRFKDTPYFGFFWANDFSHHYLSEPLSMDSKVNGYFKELLADDILDNTIVFLMSDHGIRFGKSRQLPFIGRHEDFLPLMYIRLPEWLKKERKDIVAALKANRNVLTSHFDLFMTLKDILDMSNPEYPIANSMGCPICQSLFKKINHRRTCTSIGVPLEYCACEDFSEPCDKQTSFKVGAAIVKHLNSRIAKHNKKSIVFCRFVDLEKLPIVTKQSNGFFRANVFLIPNGMVEGYVKLNEKQDLVVKNVQRIDTIGENASLVCPVERDILEFCFCL